MSDRTGIFGWLRRKECGVQKQAELTKAKVQREILTEKLNEAMDALTIKRTNKDV